MGRRVHVFDALTRRAVFPPRGSEVIATGLALRPIPVEQAADRPHYALVLAAQLAEPFVTSDSATTAHARTVEVSV